ncbi:Peroxiredoxin [Caldisphaera lagunensis DSM 15908]|uniref:thioredoxin-dependent peroxiredoxin n=1 Tax=Caldisphaera lagunensis (strain DSM 15908 / JCM 11604 / ANMR 0165 / IC-154) TaxID=1056495 RepID=L0A8R2_CALLD|nr:peroxiredoxin [Caldisphaera lagunensis]AFZ70231.1 Peroxiredoxin [Caldisphaera lagunensis DSM 15908]
MLKEGNLAPDFELTSNNGEKVKLSNFKGRFVVLYFYPRAMTAGCTREGLRFNELYDDFKKLNVEILGVSTDSVDKIKKFSERYGFKFKLLSDAEGYVVGLYGVKKDSTSLAAERTTFIIDPNGIIVKILKNIRPAEKHADQSLEELKKIINK